MISPELLRAQRRAICEKIQRILACAGRHAPGLCRYLRLSAERGRLRAHPRDTADAAATASCDDGRGRGLHRHQHLRHPRARGGPRVYGNVGALVHTQGAPSAAEDFPLRLHDGAARRWPTRIKKSYRHVDGVFNPTPALAFPGTAAVRACAQQAHLRDRRLCGQSLPRVSRSCARSNLKAWVSIMYGCNNFCSYCIVPYVRGPRTRRAGRMKFWKRCAQLVAAGYKDITLLGQNVNSYGKDLGLRRRFCRSAGARSRELPGAVLAPLHDEPPEGREPRSSLTRSPNIRRSPSSSISRSSPATTGCSRR